jgi:hypothetical protein
VYVEPAEDLARRIQAVGEGLDLPTKEVGGELVVDDTVELLGRRFHIRDKVPSMAMLKFASAAQGGMKSESMQGLAAMYALLKGCIRPEEWGEFEQHAMDTGADGDDLFPVINQTLELLGARPTKQPGGSSPGRSAISGNSTGSSVFERREADRMQGLRAV